MVVHGLIGLGFGLFTDLCSAGWPERAWTTRKDKMAIISTREWTIIDLAGMWRYQDGNLSYTAFAPRPKRNHAGWCGAHLTKG